MTDQNTQSPNTAPSESTLSHLSALVSFDTRNPPRDISVESEIFRYLKQHLSGFEFQILDAGDGCISLLATRGTPELLFNFHIDTVPAAAAWSTDPFQLIVDDEKAIGLGACDIKGASACMLTAVQQTTADVALLFSSDEEHGSSVAVKQFLATAHGFKKVIVSEPTGAKAVCAHRGIQSAKINFSGLSGHASEKRALKDSAIHKAGRWMSAALDWVELQGENFETLSGLPFNMGTIDGGIKANMIAASCELSFGFRPLPGQNAKTMLNQLHQLACEVNHLPNNEVIVSGGFFGPTLPSATSEESFNKALDDAKTLANNLTIPLGDPVDFWTEASLFSEAGMTALVFGPGYIAQAHTADEWVSLTQLQQIEEHYIRILKMIEQSSASIIS